MVIMKRRLLITFISVLESLSDNAPLYSPQSLLFSPAGHSLSTFIPVKISVGSPAPRTWFWGGHRAPSSRIYHQFSLILFLNLILKNNFLVQRTESNVEMGTSDT